MQTRRSRSSEDLMALWMQLPRGGRVRPQERGRGDGTAAAPRAAPAPAETGALQGRRKRERVNSLDDSSDDGELLEEAPLVNSIASAVDAAAPSSRTPALPSV